MTESLTTPSSFHRPDLFHIPEINRPFEMQSLELYHPTSANLHLVLFLDTNSLSENVNLLHYQLTTDDFIVLTQPDGQLLYTLDPSTTMSLFWALHRLAWYITRAASHDLHNDPSIPFVSKGYIPQAYFDRIDMKRPDILIIQDYHSINLLCGYTTRENLSAWYQDFQTMRRLAIQWIQTARQQTLQLGPGSGWNWEAHHGPCLEYPVHCLITRSTPEEGEMDIPSDAASRGSDDELSSWEDEDSDEGSPSIEKRIVLHPIKSAYAARYPNFNVFSGEPLVDNGYVDSNIDYFNTSFTYNEGMEE